MNARSLVLLTLGLTSISSLADPIPPHLRKTFSLSPFYQNHRFVGDLPIVASNKVQDASLDEAAHLIRAMIGKRPDILRAMARQKVRFTVMAWSERTCDVPEHSDLTPAAYWNTRARGLGATPHRPAVSCGEENLLHFPGDPYSTENILIHEFAHAIHQMGLNQVDPTFDQRLQTAYKNALAAGKWKNTYAASNHFEYWAEGVQSGFNTNRENDSLHNHVNTRRELQEYDPSLAALCSEIFGKSTWTYTRADHPSRKDEPHLQKLDRSKLPTFAYTSTEREAAKNASPPP